MRTPSSGPVATVARNVLPRPGWLALQQAWTDRVASEFVRRTRYDPLHEAASEQRLWDALPGWLAQRLPGC